jgi:hypothetical protein
MHRYRGIVLVDTNVILESWRVGAWAALANGYSVETVEECVMETQTGFQNRRTEQTVDRKVLLSSLSIPPHRVTDLQLAALTLSVPDVQLDPGERSLWAHALTRADLWVLCGPDKASLRVGVRLGLRDRMIALETLLDGVGHRARQPLKRAYTDKWLAQVLSELVVLEVGSGA